jgi:hypothetical protein
MQRIRGFAFFMGFLTLAGCLATSAPEAMVSVPTHVAKSFPPVTPEQITDNNGHQVAQSLEEEINREQQQNLLTSVPR